MRDTPTPFARSVREYPSNSWQRSLGMRIPRWWSVYMGRFRPSEEEKRGCEHVAELQEAKVLA